MKLSIQTTETKDIDLKLPIFWKERTQYTGPAYVGVLDDKTVVHMYASLDGQHVQLTNGTPETMVYFIKVAHKDYEEITEKEFLQAYDDMWEAIRLRPQVKTTLNAYSENC